MPRASPEEEMGYGAVAAPAAGGRINGFSRPFTDKQILFWLSNAGSVVYFYILAMNFYGADSEVGCASAPRRRRTRRHRHRHRRGHRDHR